MMDINRRKFLQGIGLAATSATMGCSADSARRLIPYIIPAEDIIPGEATWFATTCRECPAGCGLLAKNRDGRIIKVEGNPKHPINRGALCPRGQASLHGLYNPDRFSGPLQRRGDSFTELSWPAARRLLADTLRTLHDEGRGERIAFIGGLQNGTLAEFTDEWLAAFGADRFFVYEPFAYEPLRRANHIVFGEDGIPFFRIDQADFLISLGAGFLETWLSNVEYARQFAVFHEPRGNSKNFFVYVGPRQSMTAASADYRIIVEPDQEWLVALALLGALHEEARRGSLILPAEIFQALDATMAASEEARAAADRVVTADTAHRLARRFLAAKRPLVLAAGLPHSGPHATAAAVAANLLNLLKPGSSDLIDATPSSALERTASGADMRQLVERMIDDEIDLLLIHDANPVFSLPGSWEVQAALEQVKTIVSFSACADETTGLAHLILPTHTPLESWGDYSPRRGINGLMQPVMGPMFNTMHAGDLFLETARQAGAADVLSWPDFFSRLQHTWRQRWLAGPQDQSFPVFWNSMVQHGGDWQTAHPSPQPVSLSSAFAYSFPVPPSVAHEAGTYALTMYPTVQFFDGRGANRPWIQELPDPVAQTTWGGWVEVHPQTAMELKVRKGDMLRLSTPYGEIDAPVLPVLSVPPGTIALPIGQGHENYGRYATGKPANPLVLTEPLHDLESGAIIVSTRVRVKGIDRCFAIAHTDGNFFQEGRDLIEVECYASYRQAATRGREPAVDAPLPSGYNRHRDIYPAHEHKEYRWCMVVDLDRCIGCGACVVACYAENNVAIVGREQMLLGREMSWLRVQRYFSEKDHAIRYLPMLCQHCDEAPCESVCPIFAPQHSVDGLNNQVYNRCFGTRFCSQNDPYKVRRFNWFTFTRATPLDWQLNPDVTVRQKGVMEKCSFCVQRIVAAKIIAKDQGRKIRDGDFTTACAQTCPTDALTFGNLIDADSRVARMINDARAYQVLRELNTKPAVIYLRRLTQEL
jgi:anaerobic selenocysteine-containing dehydrogenase/Fe-S-cluster-containing dehydrogenase component